jgi:hypothetical protein
MSTAVHTDCPVCGISADSQFFDHTHGVKCSPEPGASIVLAEFTLPPQYCGILENFAQFTDCHAWANHEIETPGLTWIIRRDSQPLHPYLGVEVLLNPWGFNNYPVALRLDEGAHLEFVLRNNSYTGCPLKVAGRISGRYWYNRLYGSSTNDVCDTADAPGPQLGRWTSR